MAENKFASGTKLKWQASGRVNAGSGAIKKYETSGVGRGRKTRAVIARSDGSGEIRLFDSQLTAA